MNKLLKAFESNPTIKTAMVINKHMNKHPMSACFIDTITANKIKELLV